VARPDLFGGFGRNLALAVLILSVGIAGVVAVRSGGTKVSEIESSPIAQSSVKPASTPSVPDTVVTVRPVLKANVAEGISEGILQQVRSIPGIQAVAGILLATLRVEAPTGGDTEISVAGVDPEEFRPLTPDATAQAPFVWEGLNQSKTFIANEEYQIFGGKPIHTLQATLPAGPQRLQIGGVATNGSPSLAGALMSMQQADHLGLGKPTLLVVGVSKGANINTVTDSLAKALPGLTFESMLPPAGRTFYSGPSAQKAIGSFKFTANPDGTIRQDSKWINAHLVGARMPIIGFVRCHKVMIPQLRMALEEIQSAGLSNLIKPGQTGRCYQPRFVAKDPTHQLSKHAWGLAIDLNVYDNPEGSKPKMDPRIVAIFEKWGFRWGGRWTKPDGMHFELAALLSE
jgi:D-alanyl-D-alanine carboxypeptidase-like protein